MHTQRIFIYEHISGGGFNNREIPLSLFSEGFGMLRTIIEDFKALDFEVKTMLDYRILKMSNLLNCDYIMEVKRGMTIIQEFKSLIKDCQYVFIIAPEFSKVLYKFTKVAEDMGKTLLSMNSSPILLGSSKFQTYNFFKNSGILTPKTFYIKNFNYKISMEDLRKSYHLIHSPAILKPEDGVGAESVYLIRNERDLENIISKEKQYLDGNRDYVLQEYINGTDLSASIIKQENQLIILSINSQKIKLIKNKINYLGGMTPAENSDHIKKEIIELTENLDLTKFKGYFGIDFIRMADGKIYLIEINPRLTTSYLGVRNVSKANPMLLLVYPDANPDEIIDSSYKYCSEYYHMKLKYNGVDDPLELWGDIFNSIHEIITPPLPLNLKFQENKIFTCFVSIKGKNIKQIQKRKRSLLHQLKKLNFQLYSQG
jgi:tyramine---L-glutamate ligase